jgi:hypothetical protein
MITRIGGLTLFMVRICTGLVCVRSTLGGAPASPQVERVHHLPRGMLGRDVERGEVVPVVLDVRPLGDRETHLAEDRGQLVDGLADRVHAAIGQRARRQRDVDALARQPRIQLGLGKADAPRLDQPGDLVLGQIERRAAGLALVGLDRAQRLHQLGDAALLAQPLDAQRLQRRTVGGGGDPCPGIREQGGDVVRHVGSRCLLAGVGGKKLERETKKARLAGQALPVRDDVPSDQPRAALACWTSAPKPSGSVTARSARTLRSTAMPAFLMPSIRRE